MTKISSGIFKNAAIGCIIDRLLQIYIAMKVNGTALETMYLIAL